MSDTAASGKAPRLAVLAGAGRLPLDIVAACRAEGRDVIVISFAPAPRDDVEGCPHFVVALDKFAPLVRLLRAERIGEVVLAGALRRPALAELRPDAGALKIALSALSGGDDRLLRAVAAALERDAGVRVIAVQDIVAPVAAGLVSAAGVPEPCRADIDRAWAVLAALGAQDVGQALAVQQGMVLAVEAIEGTDAMIARAGSLRRAGLGPVLVKGPKGGQDRRLDMPVLGPQTVEQCQRHGFCGIVCRAGATIVVARAQVAAAADRAGIFFLAAPDTDSDIADSDIVDSGIADSDGADAGGERG